MDTDDLDQLEEQIHELLLICVDLRKENDALRQQLKQQSSQLESLSHQRNLLDEKIGYLVESLGATEPKDE